MNSCLQKNRLSNWEKKHIRIQRFGKVETGEGIGGRIAETTAPTHTDVRPGKYVRSWGEFPWESRKEKQQNKTNLCSFAGFFMSEPYHYVQSPMHATLQPN